MPDLVERWKRLLTRARLAVRGNGPESEEINPHIARTAFAQDADRIIFSNAFRRLSRKTQVHPLATNDHIHNRLTHSLEVASVGRSIGNLVGSRLQDAGLLPPDTAPHNIGEIVHAACLAHDIGNPPYGHGGESAIHSWFLDPANEAYTKDLGVTLTDFAFFDGNAQSFRVVTVLENNLGRGGMRLTYPTLAAMVKYPFSSAEAARNRKSKFGYFASESAIFRHMAEVLGLEDNGQGVWARHPLSFLAEAADDICYSLIDLEDAQEMKLLSLSEMYQAVSLLHGGKTEESFFSKGRTSPRADAAYLRSVSIGILVQDVAASFMDSLVPLSCGTFKGDLITACCQATRTTIEQAKALARERVFTHPRKITLEIGAFAVFERLLNTMVPAVHARVTDNDQSFRTCRILDLLGEKAPAAGDGIYPAYQSVIDFVAGMTDDYATFVSSQFAGAGK